MTSKEAKTRFSSARLAARAVALCGWASADVGLDVASAVLSGTAFAAGAGTAPGTWTSAERPNPEYALGPARTVVVLTTDAGATLRIALGSQAWAPASADAPAQIVALEANEQLVIDGRCAYRLDEGTATSTTWTAQ